MSEQGKVKFYSTDRRFGFIAADAGDIFFSGAALDMAGIDHVECGQLVEFVREISPKDGRERAGWMRVVE